MAAARTSAGLLFLAVLAAAQTPDKINFFGLSDSKVAPTFDHGYVAAWDLQHFHSVTIYSQDGPSQVCFAPDHSIWTFG